MTRLNMGVTCKLLTPTGMMYDMIRNAMAQELNKRLNTGVLRNLLRTRTREILEEYIEAQPEYKSLEDDKGVLRCELGVVENTAALNQIVRAVVRSIQVRINPVRTVGSFLNGSIIITAVPSDLADVLGIPLAKYTAENGDIVPWLEWLLTKGDEILVATHDVIYDTKYEPYSRTSGPIMKRVSSGGWKIPSAFSGTIENNFITRGIAAALPTVGDMMETAIRSKI